MNATIVSVPFPGILFLNMSKTTTNTTVATKFPSPSRGSYFSIKEDFETEEKFANLFPSPSRGSYFSISFRYTVETF